MTIQEFADTLPGFRDVVVRVMNRSQDLGSTYLRWYEEEVAHDDAVVPNDSKKVLLGISMESYEEANLLNAFLEELDKVTE